MSRRPRTKSKGTCALCKSTFDKSGMTKHLQSCLGETQGDAGWLCDSCAEDHKCGEDMLLPVVNSPRTGVCGYTG